MQIYCVWFKFCSFSIYHFGQSLCPSESVKNLGVCFDVDFSFFKHIQNGCKCCFTQLRDFRHVRRFLTYSASVLVANALVSSRLDYCNSMFRSLSKFNLRKLQCIQNSAARVVSNTSRYTSITPVLKKLHWLPVEHRSIFKTATLVYKFLHTGYILLHISLSAAVPIVPGAVRVMVTFLSFPSFNPRSINQLNSLATVLHLTLPLSGCLSVGRWQYLFWARSQYL